MTPAQGLGAAASLLISAGILLMIAAGYGWVPRRGPSRPKRPQLTWDVVRWPGAIMTGALVAMLSGWLALGLGTFAAVVGLPVLAGSSVRAEARIDRIEAVEEWIRRLADVLAIGVGLEQAIQSAGRTAPAAIADDVATLSARIAARMQTETALRRFADDLEDPTADLAVAALILASRRRGPGVASALTGIADSVGEEVAARRRIEADRAKPRTTARAVTVITVVIIAAGLLNRSYTSPYSSPLGQVVLAATLGFFGAALWWMHSMTQGPRPARILRSDEAGP